MGWRRLLLARDRDARVHVAGPVGDGKKQALSKRKSPAKRGRAVVPRSMPSADRADVSLKRLAIKSAIQAGRTTILPKDWELARRLRG